METRAEQKRRVILDAAGDVFLANGYVGTSMDEIAAVARVSKQTVYKHFADKETLFHELVTDTVQRSDEAGTETDVLPGVDPVADELRAFARRLLRGVMQPRVLQLRRLVIAEATRFPALGTRFYELGVRRTVDQLAAALPRHFDLDDTRLAAEHLVWLVLSIPLNRAMLLGDEHRVRQRDLDRYADAGVDAFVAAYGRRP